MYTIAFTLRGSNISFTSHTQCGKTVPKKSAICILFLDVAECIFTRIKMINKTHIVCCFSASN